MRTKYTREAIQEAVWKSTSVSAVVRSFGRKLGGGNIGYMATLIRHYRIDTSHFLGKGSNRGAMHKGGAKKLHWKKVLVRGRRGDRKEKIFRLRQAMIMSGMSYICKECGAGPEWQGKDLVLQVDHRNGNHTDNRRSNLRFLCPNCHSQTETWGSKNSARVAETKR